MNIRVSGRNVAVGDDVKQAVEVKLGHLATIVRGMDRADVVFKEEKNPRRSSEKVSVEITLEGHGHHVRCTASAPDQTAAVDKACDKLGKQLRKLNTRLIRRNQGAPKAHKKNVPGPAVEMEVPEVDVAADEPPAPEMPKVVKTKSFELSRMLPEEAIERMVLLDHSFFIFTSEETGRACVVYARDDGDIGLINADA